MPISDADLLDAVRRLRSYMSTMDNVHGVLNMVQDMDDQAIVKPIQSLIIDVPPVNLRIAHTLRAIENSRQYRDMTKKFNLQQDEDNGDN